MPKIIPRRLWLQFVFAFCAWALTPAQKVQIAPPLIARIERISPLIGKGVELAIVANAPITPQTQVLSNPDRLVIDFPNALPSIGLHNLALNRGEVRDVRVGVFSFHPPLTRIVVDWKSRQPYQVIPSAKTVIVRLNSEVAESRADRAAPGSVARKFCSRVERVGLLAGNDIELEIVANAPITPQAQVLSSPDRLVIDVPDALLGSRLHNLAVNRGQVEDVRVGLFSAHPPISRVVVDLNGPQPYQMLRAGNRVIVKLSQPDALVAVASHALEAPTVPKLIVSYDRGLLSIHSNRATLGQVLNEVQRETGADIAIPAGTGEDEIAVDLGPARASEVLTSLLNGTGFNFILIGSKDDPSRLRNVLLTPKGPEIPAGELGVVPEQRYFPNPDGASSGSLPNANKGSSTSSPPSTLTTSAPGPEPSASPKPASLPTDEELSTPMPATPDQSQAPPSKP